MPKFLAGCHYNEEEISRHLKKQIRRLASPNEWQQVCNRSNPAKTGRSCEGADFSWLSSGHSLLPNAQTEFGHVGLGSHVSAGFFGKSC
jgi:hypothetical protein